MKRRQKKMILNTRNLPDCHTYKMMVAQDCRCGFDKNLYENHITTEQY
jgi:hypothetical protein